jgi:hypothetical protein
LGEALAPATHPLGGSPQGQRLPSYASCQRHLQRAARGWTARRPERSWTRV